MATNIDAPSKGCPVAFDHDSSDYAANWEARLKDLRDSCPRAWTKSHGGYWVAAKHKDVLGIAQRPDVFSNFKSFDPETGKVTGGTLIPAIPGIRSLPNESDPPEWNGYRGFVNRFFAPRAVELRRARAEQFAAALIDMVIEKGAFDIVEDLTNPLPALVILDVFGFPLHEWRRFAEPFHAMMYTPRTEPNYIETVRGLDYFAQRVDEEIALRRQQPRDDLLTVMATGTIDGEPLSHDDIQNMAMNILGGGVDTTTALTSSVLLHLSRHPDQRQRLIDEPELRPLAREEFLRYFSPIQGITRTVSADVELDGWKMDRGDRVLLAFASANRDPDAFDKPDEIQLNRFPNKHFSFGAGTHRCLGSFLARMVYDTMLDEVLRRMPDYQVIEEGLRSYPTISVVNGWISIPARFTPGMRVGASID
jgi:cytochrome P450